MEAKVLIEYVHSVMKCSFKNMLSLCRCHIFLIRLRQSYTLDTPKKYFFQFYPIVSLRGRRLRCPLCFPRRHAHCGSISSSLSVEPMSISFLKRPGWCNSMLVIFQVYSLHPSLGGVHLCTWTWLPEHFTICSIGLSSHCIVKSRLCTVVALDSSTIHDEKSFTQVQYCFKHQLAGAVGDEVKPTCAGNSPPWC